GYDKTEELLILSPEYSFCYRRYSPPRRRLAGISSEPVGPEPGGKMAEKNLKNPRPSRSDHGPRPRQPLELGVRSRFQGHPHHKRAPGPGASGDRRLQRERPGAPEKGVSGLPFRHL